MRKKGVMNSELEKNRAKEIEGGERKRENERIERRKKRERESN